MTLFNVISAKLEVNSADNLAIDIRGTRQRDDNNMDARVLRLACVAAAVPLYLALSTLSSNGTYPAR